MAALELGWDKGNKGKPIIWKNEGLKEVGIRTDTQEEVIKIDPRYFRPTEVETLLGDPTKAKTKLGWQPKISLEELVKEMVKSDLMDAKKESFINNQKL